MKLFKFTANIYERGFTVSFLIAGIFVLISSVTQIVLTWYLGLIMNAVNEGLPAVLKYFSTMCIMLVICIVLSAVSSYIIEKITSKFNHNLRINVAKSLCKAKYSEIDMEDNGELLTMSTSDIDAFSPWVSTILSSGSVLAKIILSFVALFMINTWLTLCLIPLLPLSMIPSLILSSKLHELNTKEKEQYGKITGFISEVLDFIAVVKSYCLEEVFNKKNKRHLADYEKARRKRQLREQVIWTFGRCFINIINPLLFIIAGAFILNGSMSIGQIFTVILLVGIIADGVNVIFEFPTTYASANVAMNRIMRLINMSIEEDSDKKLENINNVPVFMADEISFTYNENRVLRNVSFKINKGEKVAITGISGSGKTTLFKLLLGLYTNNSGTLELLGQNILQVSANEIRKNISVITQESFIFEGTIKDNLLQTNEDTNIDDIILACKNACIHDFIMSLDKGYDTIITGITNTLSKGQMQRINIARAFLKNKSIWLLDEPTSALDFDNSENVMDFILNQNSDKTILVITHEQKTASRFDRIINMRDGEII